MAVHLRSGDRSMCGSSGSRPLSDDRAMVTCSVCAGWSRKVTFPPLPRYPSPGYCALCGLSNGHGFGCDGKAKRLTVERRAS